jgi:3-oxoacyl-[acyl-carrier-protein] synthase II
MLKDAPYAPLFNRALQAAYPPGSTYKMSMVIAGVEADAIDYVSAHGTSTHANDAAETKALHTVFGDHAKELAITGVKSQIGHLLGASGGVSSIFAALSLQTGMVPGTINLENPDPECDLNYMAEGTKKLDPKYAIVNALGFGGTNGCLVLKKYED